MTEVRQELLRFIALNHAEQWVPNDVAFQQLFERHGDLIINHLIECLPNENEKVRQLAAGLLDEAGNRAEPAVHALTQRLTDEDRSVVITAMFTLKRLAQFAQSAIPAIKIVLTNSTEPYLQIMAAATHGKIAPEDSSTVPILIAALDDPIGFNRATACEFLGERRHKSGVLCTIKLLNDEDFSVRFAAAEAIGLTFGNWIHALGICLELLKDEGEFNRCVGGESLLSIKQYIQNDLDVVSIAISTAPSWEARIDIEELLHQLRSP